MIELIKLLLKLKFNSRPSRSLLLNSGLALVVVGISSFFALAALVFIILALYFYLSTILNPYMTALVVGLICIVVACCLLFSTKYILRSRKEEKTHKHKDELEQVQNIVSSTVKDYPIESALAVAALGFVLSTSTKSSEALAESILWAVKQTNESDE